MFKPLMVSAANTRFLLSLGREINDLLKKKGRVILGDIPDSFDKEAKQYASDWSKAFGVKIKTSSDSKKINTSFTITGRKDHVRNLVTSLYDGDAEEASDDWPKLFEAVGAPPPQTEV